ncbi:CDGSH iron-sulfur domain-containing protein [Kitasatospora sp. NPDC093550]|uniref:CDGSH iron-sulfur domain-containing protein n=1 Tax=Kitasatospora sp. NPDC093550 TaxID=3364089 RepID=UPI00382C05C0
MSANADRTATRVVVVPGGPLLVEGPVEVVLPDGTVRLSERPVVALCACRRSRTYPFCDTSHRRRGRPARSSDREVGHGREPGPDSERDGQGREPGPDSERADGQG